MSDEERWKIVADGLRELGKTSANAAFCRACHEMADKLDPPKRKRTVWVNIYGSGAYGYDSRKEADDEQYSDSEEDRFACVRIETEEGRFDD